MKRNTPLRTLRRARTFSQANFAQLLGISQQNYSKYESGAIVPPVHMQARIAAYLGVGVVELWPATEKSNSDDEPKVASAR